MSDDIGGINQQVMLALALLQRLAAMVTRLRLYLIRLVSATLRCAK